jgi:hypothetical protein
MPCLHCAALDKELASFTFDDILNADPPKKKGVYVIRVIKRGQPFQETVEKLREHVRWQLVIKYVFGRLERLNRIDNKCNLIYIGSAGTYKNSKNTLKGRYKEFASRHTIQFPIWLMLAIGWELEYGWLPSDDPRKLEDDLKQLYLKSRNNTLPALVKK